MTTYHVQKLFVVRLVGELAEVVVEGSALAKRFQQGIQDEPGTLRIDNTSKVLGRIRYQRLGKKCKIFDLLEQGHRQGA